MIPDRKSQRAVAFFDIDGTVLSVSSGTLYTRFLAQEGKASRTFMLKAMWWYALHRLGRLDIEKMTRKVVAGYEGESESRMIADCNRWYESMVRQYVRPQMIDAIARHREMGHEIVLLTAVTIYLARPLGEDLGVDGYVCNYLEVEDGIFTGRMVEPLCYGKGKVLHAEKYTAEHGADLAASYFYTDSITDLDVLLRVGYPVIINPDPLLRREAKKRNWPVHDYSHNPQRREG